MKVKPLWDKGFGEVGEVKSESISVGGEVGKVCKAELVGISAVFG